MSLAGRKRRATLRPICEINVTAFLSIQVALLFMFFAAVNNWHDLGSGNSTDNPKVVHPTSMRGAIREDAMIVAVQRTGDVWLGYERISLLQLPERIQQDLKAGAERKVYINADSRAKYGRVREVLAVVQSSGVEKVGFLVWQGNPPYPDPASYKY